MDSRGNPSTITVSRLSCNQCRSRKIGCDRGSPCSNCVSGRLECTHSARAKNTTPAKQRVLISAQYERKIDDIARDVNIIKAAVQGSDQKRRSSDKRETYSETPSQSATNSTTRYEPRQLAERRKAQSTKEKNVSSWDHSIQIVDFVKSVVESNFSSPGNDGLASRLKSLFHAMTDTSFENQLPGIDTISSVPPEACRIPPIDAVLLLLRWVKAHRHFHRVVWISQILPIAMFENICRKVYFAVDEYTHIDYILAVGFLSYMFSEHRVSTGTDSSGVHSQKCREALSAALLKLPFMLPSTLEVVAMLLMATLHSIESSKSTAAWIYISSAINHCQTLRYHRAQDSADDMHNIGSDLFISVYRFEKGLSLRLGRSSGTRDSDITLPLASDKNRATRSAQIQGQVYDRFYSLGGLSNSEERVQLARALSEEVRGILIEIRAELSQCLVETGGDIMRELYLRGDLVCHTSLLALILRAIPIPCERTNVSNECIMAAREVFELHQQCMLCVRNSNDPPTMARYLNWAILHVPFAPFSILFTRAIQIPDLDDLDRLGRFSESLKPYSTSGDETSTTHPYRLYDLLYQTARLYIESGHCIPAAESSSEMTATHGPYMSNDERAGEFINEMGEYDPMFGQFDTSIMDLGEWFQGNQQLVRLLDDGSSF